MKKSCNLLKHTLPPNVESNVRYLGWISYFAIVYLNTLYALSPFAITFSLKNLFHLLMWYLSLKGESRIGASYHPTHFIPFSLLLPRSISIYYYLINHILKYEDRFSVAPRLIMKGTRVFFILKKQGTVFQFTITGS